MITIKNLQGHKLATYWKDTQTRKWEKKGLTKTERYYNNQDFLVEYSGCILAIIIYTSIIIFYVNGMWLWFAIGILFVGVPFHRN